MRNPASPSEKLTNRESLKGHAEAVTNSLKQNIYGSARQADYSPGVSVLKKSHVLIISLLIDNGQV